MSQMYPAFSQSKKSKSNRQLIEDLKDISLNWYDVESQGYTLPSTLEPHSWCGQWIWRGCMNISGHEHTEAHGKGFVKTFEKQCFRASCEKCASSWISRESNKSASRLEHYQNMTNQESKHIILSPPEYLLNKPIPEVIKEAYKILKNLNAKGGCLIVHPFRAYKQTLLDGKIKLVWFPRLHFHVVGFGWLGNTAENYRRSGWVVKNKGERDSNYGTIRYILSHAGIKKRQHTLRWFGDLSYSKLSMPKYESELNLCPYCSEKMVHVLDVDGSMGEPPPQMMECIVNAEEWFTPEYPQFLR